MLFKKVSLTSQWQFCLRPWWNLHLYQKCHWLVNDSIISRQLMAMCHWLQSMTRNLWPSVIDCSQWQKFMDKFSKTVIDRGQWQKKCHWLDVYYIGLEYSRRMAPQSITELNSYSFILDFLIFACLSLVYLMYLSVYLSFLSLLWLPCVYQSCDFAWHTTYSYSSFRHKNTSRWGGGPFGLSISDPWMLKLKLSRFTIPERRY